MANESCKDIGKPPVELLLWSLRECRLQSTAVQFGEQPAGEDSPERGERLGRTARPKPDMAADRAMGDDRREIVIEGKLAEGDETSRVRFKARLL